MSILQNRPYVAALHLKELTKLLPGNPWPSIYLTIIELAKWNPWKAKEIADIASNNNSNVVLIALRDVSGILSGEIWRIKSASINIPKAIEEIENQLN